MGNFSSNLGDVPDNDFTTCANLLKRLNVRMVFFTFRDLIQNLDLPLPFQIPQYTESARTKLIQTLSENISPTASAFIITLLTRGITVVIQTGSSKGNGEVSAQSPDKGAGYIFDGKPLVENVFNCHYGPEQSQYIHILEATGSLQGLHDAQNAFHYKPEEIIFIQSDPELIRQVRKHHMLGLLIDDHKVGFRLG